jgi:hypothetical protein
VTSPYRCRPWLSVRRLQRRKGAVHTSIGNASTFDRSRKFKHSCGALSSELKKSIFSCIGDASEINRVVDVLTNGTSARRKIPIYEDMRRSGCSDDALKARGRLVRIESTQKN